MALEKIISITGKPGLFTLVSQLKNGFIIEDVITKKKVSISNSSQVSLLDNIAMFTKETEVPLFSVFENIAKENNYEATISHKSKDTELREFMSKALPNYDESRVYVSDIKKMVQWYNILHKSGYINKENFETKSTEESSEKVVQTENQPKQPKNISPKTKATSVAKSSTKSTRSKKG